MRPKRIILYVSENEQDVSIARFLLVTHGYAVLSAANGPEAIKAFSGCLVDLVLADYEMKPMNGGQLVDKLKLIAPHVPMILLGEPGQVDQVHVADAMVAKKNCSPLELLERIKCMSARRRGPRPGVVRARPEEVVTV